MQLLPSTYAKIKRENPAFGPIHDARWNIAAGIYYNRQNYDLWDNLVSQHMEALRFTLASYNAGPNRIQLAYEKAKKRGTDASRWTMVEKHAPRTTRHYVRKVHQLMGTEVQAPADTEAPAIPPRG
jgi:membrane-bound lytic murein transglycosylase F